MRHVLEVDSPTSKREGQGAHKRCFPREEGSMSRTWSVREKEKFKATQRFLTWELGLPSVEMENPRSEIG